MTGNLVEIIQKNLGYSQLKKVDPNVQDTKESVVQSAVDKLGQAAIPAVLTAIYKFSRTEEGATQLIGSEDHEDWLGVIYAGKEEGAVEKISQYAGVTPGEAEGHMENIADESVKVIKDQIGPKPTQEKLRSLLAGQRHSILVYLPAALKMGDLLNDEALDDKTNKMEGPISNLMHKIENSFSKGDEKTYP